MSSSLNYKAIMFRSLATILLFDNSPILYVEIPEKKI